MSNSDHGSFLWNPSHHSSRYLKLAASQARVIAAFAERRRRRRLDSPAPRPLGVGQIELGGVEHQAGDFGPGNIEQAAILAVACDRPAERGDMSAELVHATGLWIEFDEGGVRRCGACPVTR